MRPAELEQALRAGALGVIDRAYLHRALLETPAGEHHARGALREHWAGELSRFPDARVTTIADLETMSASRVEAAPDGAAGPVAFGVHRWVRREGAAIAGEIVISDAAGMTEPLDAAAQRIGTEQLPEHPPLGELRAGAGQFAPGPRALLAGDPPPAARTAADLWQRFWNGREFDVAHALAPDAAEAAVLRRFALRWLTALPDALLLFDRAVAEGDTAALLWRLHGHHHGQLFGHAPTRRRLRLWGSVVLHMENGRAAGAHMAADEAAALAGLHRAQA